MVFNSISFLSFFLAVFIGYWSLNGRRRAQNLFLLVASYVFYGMWNWRYLFLIFGCSLVNFVAGKVIYESRSKFVRRLSLTICCIVCLGALCYFKYFNFFIDSFATMMGLFGIKWNPVVLNIMLPVGISFFTFQALSYTIDILIGKLKPTRNWVEFFVFISFFPQLVAGPIERASNLLPQFQNERTFDFNIATHGVCLVAYGLFKKMVVADTLALYVDAVFRMPELYSSLTCIIGALFFSVQIYCDFSGYSDCARGIAQLLGFKLMVNFNRPYLATSFVDFWRRWHISLSTWFKDYVYIPLGGNRRGFMVLVRNVWIVFLLSGLWHGASWTFIIWGGLHATYQTVDLIVRRFLFGKKTDLKPAWYSCLASVVLVNIGVTFAWIVFRAHTFSDLKRYLDVLFACNFHTSIAGLCALQGPMVLAVCLFAISMLALSYVGPRDCAYKTLRGRFIFTMICASTIVFLGMPAGGEFIYFQF